METDPKLRKLLLDASKSPELRRKFLKQPKAFAAERGVTLTPAQVARVKKASALINSLGAFHGKPRPPQYSLYTTLDKWSVAELLSAITSAYAYGWRIPLPIYRTYNVGYVANVARAKGKVFEKNL